MKENQKKPKTDANRAANASSENMEDNSGVSLMPPIQRTEGGFLDTISSGIGNYFEKKFSSNTMLGGIKEKGQELWNSITDDKKEDPKKESPAKEEEKSKEEGEDEKSGGEPSIGTKLELSSHVGFSENFKNRKKDVKALQSALVKLGYNIKVNGKIGMHRNAKNKLKADLKSAGKETITAIHCIQYIHGLKPDGKVKKGGDTHEKINEALAAGTEINHNFNETSKEKDFPATSHSSIQEAHLLTKDKKGEGLPKQLFANMNTLIKQLEIIGDEYGSIKVISGYRSPKANSTTEGKAEGSKHMYGMAVDLVPKEKGGVKVLREKILELIKAGTITPGGVGKYSSFVHYDVRGKLQKWNG